MKKLKAFVRYSGEGIVVPSSLILAYSKPKVGKWIEVDAYECCNPTTTTSSSSSTTTSLPFSPSEYGLLYNWYAAFYNNGGASIAPVGWHIPSKTEFVTLFDFVGEYFGEQGEYSPDAGGILKETGTTHWLTPNEGATNSVGFSMRGNGYRTPDGTFGYINEWGTLMTTTPTDPSEYVNYVCDNASAGFYWAQDWMEAGYGIRLIKDDSNDPGSLIDYDGNIYPTVKIGNQVWMAANLMVTHYNDGVLIPEVTDNSAWAALTTGALCAYNNDWNNV